METMNSTSQNTPIAESEWGGLTLHELRMRRGIALIKLELQKERLVEGIQGIIGEKKSEGYEPKGLARFLPGNILDKFSYIDYAVMGSQLFKTARKVKNLIKR